VFKKSYVLIAALALVIIAGGIVASRHASRTPNKQTPASTNSSDTSATSSFDKTRYSTTDPASPWVIVNKQHPLNPISYAPRDLASVGNGQQMRAEAATALNHMFGDAQTAGYSLVADSGYRSYDYQVSVYNGYIKQWGQDYTDTVSARPGYSEHQTGWAVDIGTGSCHVADCFADTPAGKWTQANAYKYGFLLRYPQALTSITGYSNEAWHFRYVGPLLSNELHSENSQTLEQFFGVPGGTTYK
jgi:D-alanyl-D-alanine carboxypeptidase